MRLEKTQTFFINQNTCIKCGICVEICPANCIKKDTSNLVNFKSDFKKLCLGCGQCMAVCNSKSVNVPNFDYSNDFFEISTDADFLSVLQNRRSVRRFKPQPVSTEEIKKILNCVSMAPHGDSHHHVEVNVINNREKIMEALPIMSKFYDKLKVWLHNPFMRKMIEIKKGKHTLNTLKNHLLPRIEMGIYKNISYEYDGITRGAHSLLIFHAPKDSEEHFEDAYIFVTYATLAAQAMGIGSTIIGLVPAAINKSAKLRKKFQIPDNHEAVVSLILGYPKYKYKRAIKRNLKKVNWIE